MAVAGRSRALDSQSLGRYLTSCMPVATSEVRLRRVAGALVVGGSLVVAAFVSVAACAADYSASAEGAEAGALPPVDGVPHDGAPNDGARRDASIMVELGTGSASFVPLKNGDKIGMVRGKQGFQHVWISARVLWPPVHEALVTLSTRLRDGRPGGPPLSTAVTLEPVDGGAGATETVGMTGLVDYAVIGKTVDLHIEVTTADGQWGVDDRTIEVLAPVEHRCLSDAGTTTCDALCGSLLCTTCEMGSLEVGYLDRAGAPSLTVGSCTTAVAVDDVTVFACCCCR